MHIYWNEKYILVSGQTCVIEGTKKGRFLPILKEKIWTCNVRLPLYFRAELAKLVSQILLDLLVCFLDMIPDLGRHLKKR